MASLDPSFSRESGERGIANTGKSWRIFATDCGPIVGQDSGRNLSSLKNDDPPLIVRGNTHLSEPQHILFFPFRQLFHNFSHAYIYIYIFIRAYIYPTIFKLSIFPRCEQTRRRISKLRRWKKNTSFVRRDIVSPFEYERRIGYCINCILRLIRSPLSYIIFHRLLNDVPINDTNNLLFVAIIVSHSALIHLFVYIHVRV